MVHPNQIAIDYIWDLFKKAWIDPSCDSLMHEVDGIQKGLLHKPFNPDTKQHQEFRKNLEEKINRLKQDYGILF